MYTDKQRRELVKLIKEKREEGLSWRGIARLLDYSCRDSARNIFYYHSRRVGVPNKKVGRPRKAGA